MKTVNEFLEKYKDYKIKDEEALLKLLEKSRPKTVWDLQKGDKYYFLDSAGEICESIWDDDTIDNRRRNNRRCYLTEQDVEFAKGQEIIIAELERLGGTMDMMYLGDVDDCKYFLIYDHMNSILDVEFRSYSHFPLNIYFGSKAQAQKAIDEVGEDRIKKYIFYVKENNNE